MNQDLYPLFLPPSDLAEKGAKNWNKEECAKYNQWFLSEIPNRLNGLSTFLSFEINSDNPLETFLICAGRTCLALNDGQFFQMDEDKKVLTPGAGYSIGADVGILFAHLLLSKSTGSIEWRAGNGAKTYVSLNLAVLWGFSGAQELDPVLVGINLCRNALRESSVERWQHVYEYWQRSQL